MMLNFRKPLLAIAVAVSVATASCGRTSQSSTRSSPVAAASVPRTTATTSSPPPTVNLPSHRTGYRFPAEGGSVSTITKTGLLRDSNDGDEDSKTNDDRALLFHGRVATPSEQRAISALVRRFYATDAAGDAARLCSLMYRLYAEGAAELAEEELEQSGKAIRAPVTCVSLAAQALKEHHAELAAEAPTVKFFRIRINGYRGTAYVETVAPTLQRVQVHREGSVWKIDAFLPDGMP